MTTFQLCICGTDGWKRLPVEIDVPEMISDIEARMRANEKLSEDQSGQLKKFWRAVDAAARNEHGVVGRETTILKPVGGSTVARCGHVAPIGTIHRDRQSGVDVELTNPQRREDDPRSLIRQAEQRASWSLQLHPVILLRTFVAGYKTKRSEIHYPEGSRQLAWQDRHGFIWLRGLDTGWEIATCSKPGVDFSWAERDPRTPEQIAAAREIPAAVSYGEEPKDWKRAWLGDDELTKMARRAVEIEEQHPQGFHVAGRPPSPDERPHPDHKWATPKLERLWKKYQAALDKLPAHEQERLLLEASTYVRRLRDMDPLDQEATLAASIIARACPCGSGNTFEDCHGLDEDEVSP